MSWFSICCDRWNFPLYPPWLTFIPCLSPNASLLSPLLHPSIISPHHTLSTLIPSTHPSPSHSYPCPLPPPLCFTAIPLLHSSSSPPQLIASPLPLISFSPFFRSHLQLSPPSHSPSFFPTNPSSLPLLTISPSALTYSQPPPHPTRLPPHPSSTDNNVGFHEDNNSALVKIS